MELRATPPGAANPPPDLTALLARKVDELAGEVRDREAAEARLAQALEERETLLRELHHRVKNNLQFLSGLIRLHERGAGTDSATFRELRTRIEAMGFVHKHIYAGDNLASVGLAGYMRDLVTSLAQTYPAPAVAITTEIADDLRIPLERAIPLGLVLNELISNALRHAFPHRGAGAITITVAHADDGLRVTVADDGAGPASPAGHPAALGLRLVHGLVSQLGGTLEAPSVPGTMHVITIPA